MTTWKTFMKLFEGHADAYSSYMVIGVTLHKLIEVLNEIDPDMVVGSGKVSNTGKSIYFEICKETPDLIHKITSKLHCRGFADTGAWYGDAYFEASFDGKSFDGFTAKWRDGEPTSDEDLWDAFVTITDNESKEVFEAGEGSCDKDAMERWKHLVDTH